MPSVEHRLAALEAAVFGHVGDDRAGGSDDVPDGVSPEGGKAPEGGTTADAGEALTARRDVAEAQADPLWIVHTLQQLHPDGVVALAGHMPVGQGVAWQFGRPTSWLLGADWSERAAALDALGNPVRLRILQLIVSGTASTHALAEHESLGTSGQLHHHLRALKASGWITTAKRGEYAVPPHRLIPLLVCLMAAEP